MITSIHGKEAVTFLVTIKKLSEIWLSCCSQIEAMQASATSQVNTERIVLGAFWLRLKLDRK
ncbi:hypothetical protein ACXX9E_29685 [Pseudomonas sp. GNP014]